MTDTPERADVLPFPTTNAMEWVAAFRRTFPDANMPDDVMLGWFANAIEHGRGPDAARQQPSVGLTALRALSDAATPGPWLDPENGYIEGHARRIADVRYRNGDADRAFIVAAVNYVRASLQGEDG